VTEAIPDTIAAAHFAARLLAWHDTHGRHDLPWQQHIDPTACGVGDHAAADAVST